MIGGLIAVGVLGATVITLGILRAMDSRRTWRIWRSLEVPGSRGDFSEALVQDLPEAVQRYFCHAISPSAPLYSRVSLRISGRIKTGKDSPWLPFAARQILTPHNGFVWKAQVRKGPISLEVVDHYAQREGRTRVALFGLVPIANSTGPDLSKSALGRLMAESILVPSALLPQQGVSWEAEGANHIKATLTAYGEITTLDISINDEGGLQEVTLLRYGDQTETGQWAYIPFGVAVDGEGPSGGYTIPLKFRGGWWYGTERYHESIQFTIEEAVFG